MPERIPYWDTVSDPKAAPILDVVQVAAFRNFGAAQFGAIVAIYAREAPRQVSGLRVTLESGDQRTLSELAHALKGSSASLGAARIAVFAARVERAAREGDRGACVQAIAALESNLPESIARLEALCRDADLEAAEDVTPVV